MSEDIQQYVPMPDGEMEPHPVGGWVRYDDYVHERETLVAALQSIIGEFVTGQRTTYGDVTKTIDRIRETAANALARIDAEGKTP